MTTHPDSLVVRLENLAVAIERRMYPENAVLIREAIAALEANPGVVEGFVLVPRERLQCACNLLAERMYGNPARSPAHNARMVIEEALALSAAPKASAPVEGGRTDKDYLTVAATPVERCCNSSGTYACQCGNFISDPAPPVAEEMVMAWTDGASCWLAPRAVLRGTRALVLADDHARIVAGKDAEIAHWKACHDDQFDRAVDRDGCWYEAKQRAEQAEELSEKRRQEMMKLLALLREAHDYWQLPAGLITRIAALLATAERAP